MFDLQSILLRMSVALSSNPISIWIPLTIRNHHLTKQTNHHNQPCGTCWTVHYTWQWCEPPSEKAEGRSDTKTQTELQTFESIRVRCLTLSLRMNTIDINSWNKTWPTFFNPQNLLTHTMPHTCRMITDLYTSREAAMEIWSLSNEHVPYKHGDQTCICWWVVTSGM